jgi:hypothetical protein
MVNPEAAKLDREVELRKAAKEKAIVDTIKPYGFDAMPTDPLELARLQSLMKGEEKPVEPLPLADLGISTVEVTLDQRCEGCGKTFETKAIMIGGRPLCPQFCPPCVEERRASGDREKRVEREIQWEAICPEDYQATDLARIREHWKGIVARDSVTKDPVALDAILGADEKHGLILAGESGLCKTRIMFLICRKLHFAGWRVAYINGATFADRYASQFGKAGEAEKFINAFITAPVLFYDDLGKEPLIGGTKKMSDRSEEALYRIVEERKAHRRKLFATCNLSGKQMLERLSEDRGMPIVRRLREMCRTINIVRET